MSGVGTSQLNHLRVARQPGILLARKSHRGVRFVR